MKPSNFSIHAIAALVFATGILASTLLTGGLTWAGLEASQYGFIVSTNEHFGGLACPLIMTRSETGTIRLSVDNPSNMVVTPIVSLEVSTPGLSETRQTQVSVAPGQTGRLAWNVSARNIDRGFFIFAHAERSASYPLPAAEALCGILVLDVSGLSGAQILFAWLAVCLVCIPLGLWLWRLRRGPAYNMPGAMRALAVTALCGLLVSLPGLWLPGVAILVLTILLTAGLLTTLIRL